jgi:hypothetical protein
MRCSYAYGLKNTVAAVIASAFIAGGVSAMTSPAISQNNKTEAISVDRNHKGDRLPQASSANRRPSNTELMPASPERPPLGCDPAFSPVADPAHRRIFKRCMA